ncbi:hypothetical protein DVH24_001400, partial [Malus domestica]
RCNSRNDEPLGHPFFYFYSLKVEFAYDINKFCVVRNRTSNKFIPHVAMVELNKRTTIVKTVTGFQDSALGSLSLPIVVALTALKVKQHQGSTGSTICFFNPDIPQFPEYKHWQTNMSFLIFFTFTFFAIYLPNPKQMYGKGLVTGDSELKTIEQLFLLDPALNKLSPPSLAY